MRFSEGQERIVAGFIRLRGYTSGFIDDQECWIFV